MLARWHVNINQLHCKPSHEDEEGKNSENTADGCVVRRVVLIGETDWLAEPVEFTEELLVLLFRHYQILINYYKIN